MTNTRTFATVCFALLLASGCGGNGRPDTIPVSGTVVYQGQPLAEAEVTFMPTGGRPAMGRTDDAGRFVLATFGDEDGATPGDYKVTIAKTVKKDPNDNSPYPARVSVIPERYAHASQSGLTATVDESSDNEFHFELTDR